MKKPGPKHHRQACERMVQALVEAAQRPFEEEAFTEITNAMPFVSAPLGFVPEIGGDYAAGVRKWQPEALAFLTQVVERRNGGQIEPRRARGMYGAVLPGVEVGALDYYVISGPNGEFMLVVEGAARDVYFYFLFALLRVIGLARLMRCTCGSLFVKTGRREFCSKRCQHREYMRREREGDRAQRERETHGKKTRTR